MNGCGSLTLVGCLTCALSLVAPVSAEEGGARLEEIIVTAEKRESTVSDTPVSLTAFDDAMLQEFGIQGADELIDYIPATTRDDYDIRIRGVGRNFRALGGDPGVATYYNGVYSEVFGNLHSREFYGVLSGPLVADKLAYRLLGVRRDRDGSQQGIDGSEDVNSVGDQNVAVSLNWRPTHRTEFNVRWNDRRSDRIIGTDVLITEGPITSSGEQLRGGARP